MDNICFCGLTGEIITPKDPDYNELRQEWNRAIQKYPIAIVYCYDKHDVANAIIWSRCNCVSLRVRNGGHNYEGYSTGDDVIVIDVSRMDCIYHHNDLLTIGGGVSNSQLYDFISSQGYPFPGGTCPTVGVSGYALGGGWGLSCRLFGLGCDNLVELEIVDYQGNLLTANTHVNRELFWACRGAGGGNFGVVVSLTFRLPPKINRVTFIEFYYPDTDKEKQAQFLEVWQNWLIDADERITLISNIYHSLGENFAVYGRGIFYGEPQEAKIILQPFIDLGGCNLNLEYLSFLECINKIEATYPNSQMFKSTGRFVVRPFNSPEISQVVGLIRDIPEGSVYSGLTLYALGGKVSEISRHDTAFFYRNAKYIILIQSVWTDEQYAQINTQWVNQKFKYLKSVTEGSYVNFPYNKLTDYLEEYYGQNAERLRIVKEIYDPFDVFHFPQSINQII